jgi:ATP-dependent DNA helicase DinG
MKEVDVYDIAPIKLDKTPRPAQTQLLNFTKDCVLSNKKFIMIDAPVGIGKSYYAVMAMDWFKKNYNASTQFDVLTNSKILQEQYTHDFDFINSLWGKGSYECERHQTDCGTGTEWCRLQNSKCDNCPYAIAKTRFEMGDVALTNFHLFLTYQVYMPMAWKRSSQVLIIDEAHDFDSVFCDFITTKISKPMLKRNGFTDDEINQALSVFGMYPEDLSSDVFVKLVKEDFLAVVKTVINRISREAEGGNMQAVNYMQSLGNNFLKWDMLFDEYNKMSDNWIVEIEKIKKKGKDGQAYDEYYEFTAQPVWAHPYLAEKVWDKYDYVIFMSGTILDKKMFSKMNGIDPEQADYISIESPFPVENRPIYYFSKTGKQTFKTKELVWMKQKEVLAKILKKHKKDKGIIHTANYEIQGWVVKEFGEDRILAHDSTNRADMLQLHYNTDRPTVLTSPSMMTGVDLKEDYSRHQTILKMPYPNLGSKKIKKRMDTMQDWYTLKTVQDMIQMYGRSVRSIDDKAKTYILDSCFGDVLKWGGKWIPQWIKDAIQYID